MENNSLQTHKHLHKMCTNEFALSSFEFGVFARIVACHFKIIFIFF